MAQTETDVDGRSEPDHLVRLERQIERGSLFAHTALSSNADRLHEAEFLLFGLIDLLIGKQLLAPGELTQAADSVRSQMQQRGETLGPGVALRIDAPLAADAAPVLVDCERRLPVCQAVCCRLHFALSAEEVEASQIRWDLGQPYYIRQEANGCCTHLESDGRRCQVYDHRPEVCRNYSCARDTRIWKDFENMELNAEWIQQNLGGQKVRLAWASMQRLPAEKSNSESGS